MGELEGELDRKGMATSENSCTTSKIRRVRRGAALGIHLGVQALEVSKAAPPWLPFVAFANVMAAKDEQVPFALCWGLSPSMCM